MLQYFSQTNWKGAGWWIIANIIAWFVAGLFAIIVGLALVSADPIPGWIGAVVLLWPLSMLKD